MVRRLLVNDRLNTLGEHTFWMDLMEWFGMEFVGGDYATLADKAERASRLFPGVPLEECNASCSDPYNHADIEAASLIIRNATWFQPIKTDVPTISLLQDIITEGPQREMQESVIKSSVSVVYNSWFTASKYEDPAPDNKPRFKRIIPLPVDFSLFEPQNTMGCQQALGLPDGAVCWVGASQNAAGHVKGWDIFISVVRRNPDIPFVAIFKDAAPEWGPPNLRMYTRLPQSEMVKVIGACRLGLCTSRMESQHLAGIEMGACGLPLVAPQTGTYWKREGMPGYLMDVGAIEPLVSQIVRTALSERHDPDQVRAYWQKEFDKPVIRAQWEKLVQEVECSGAS